MNTLTQPQRDFMGRFAESDRAPVIIIKRTTRNMLDRLIEKGFIHQVSISHTGQHAVIEITEAGKQAISK
jgi:DNA-binding HxlR family transcriptional regulator